jgi:signal transduction histidine kinase
MSPSGPERELEELREATGKISHDLGNSLQVIVGRAFLLEHKLGDNNPAAGDVAAISRAAEEAVELTGRLLELGIKRD